MKTIFFLALGLFLHGALHAAGNNNEQSADELAKELETYNKQAEQALQQIDKMVGVSTPDPKLELIRQKAMRLASDDQFLKAAQDLWKHPDRNKMLAIQAAFFLFMIILKAWRQSRATHWFRKLLIGFFFSIFTLVGVSYAVPLLVLGEPFGVFTGTLFKVLVSS